MSANRLPLLLASLLLGGCASTHHNPKDPFEPFNRGVYQFNETVDKAIIKPAAKGYNAVMPVPGKIMVSNFFSNLDDFIVTINDLLQLKIVNAVSDGGRIFVNSTIGLGGLVDVASMGGLEKRHEDFGQTLGYWGVGSGPYLVIPLFGPSSVRDGVGLYADTRSDVLRRVSHVDTRNQLYATRLLSKRADLLHKEKVLEEAMIDRYSFVRDGYLQRRKSLIYDGNPPREKFDDDENDSAPDKTSVNDHEEGMQPAATEAAAVVAPDAAVGTEPSAPQQTGVYRIWLSQRKGIR
ncbi:MAG: VacJ family lipoprotein [Nitrosomonadales bacterium]|nr:VacJ family lipoprotein [Nitrosomonadales bacterium]